MPVTPNNSPAACAGPSSTGCQAPQARVVRPIRMNLAGLQEHARLSPNSTTCIKARAKPSWSKSLTPQQVGSCLQLGTTRTRKRSYSSFMKVRGFLSAEAGYTYRGHVRQSPAR